MARPKVVLILVTLGIIGFSDAKCPDGWQRYGPSCYSFSGDQQTWTIAQDLCKEFGGYLAEVESKNETDYLQTLARVTKRGYWIGGRDDKTEGNWYWANSGHPFKFTAWSAGEPNNLNNEDCLHFFAARQETWNDFPCSTKQNYICETSYNSAGTSAEFGRLTY